MKITKKVKIAIIFYMDSSDIVHGYRYGYHRAIFYHWNLWP